MRTPVMSARRIAISSSRTRGSRLSRGPYCATAWMNVAILSCSFLGLGDRPRVRLPGRALAAAIESDICHKYVQRRWFIKVGSR
ncbi:MAG: hypothetical protein DYG90_09200 [Chloroflexi bacterium CFX6]|nr:hypothetical protein [Chloroflexi bacterium CFX6]